MVHHMCKFLVLYDFLYFYKIYNIYIYFCRFRDYGIIESYPQKWYFEKEGIGFEIYESKTSPTTTNKHTANDAIDMVSNSKQYTIRWIKTNSKDEHEVILAISLLISSV